MNATTQASYFLLLLQSGEGCLAFGKNQIEDFYKQIKCDPRGIQWKKFSPRQQPLHVQGDSGAGRWCPLR